MSAPRLDLILVAYQCGPDMGSVSQIGWNWFVNLVQRGHRVTLVTHSRNHASIAAALQGLPDVQHQADILYIDTEWLAGPLYRGARRLFPHSEHGVFMLSQLDYFAFDHAASRALRAQMKQGRRWQLVHIARFGSTDAPRIVDAAKQAGVHELILRLPAGYETPLGEGGVVLSGGQRQRIGLARALYGSPTLVVLDEPNANLDEAGDAALLTAIKGLKAAGKTVVIVTHRANLLSEADSVLVLVDGRVQAFGPRGELLKPSLPKALPQPIKERA